jgi:ATP-binding cassette subfamily C (CFTR/MRP) protein 4
MTSVERIIEYCHLEHEGPHETDVKPPENWPNKGQIEFDNMSFSYHKGLPNVLHHVSCIIKPTEKVYKSFNVDGMFKKLKLFKKDCLG